MFGCVCDCWEINRGRARWDCRGCFKPGMGKGASPRLGFGIGMENEQKFRDGNWIRVSPPKPIPLSSLILLAKTNPKKIYALK